MSETNISSAQRAQNFSAATRRNYHTLPSRTVNQLGETVQFNYPKARLLSKTMVKFECTFAEDVSTFINNTNTYPYEIIRRISLSMNNGWEPFVISGRDLALMNMISVNPNVYIPSNKNLVQYEGKKLTFMLELENTLNQRDCSGLIILQNEATQCVLSIDLATNYGATLESCKITPTLVTYTVPNYKEAFPDISVIKLVKARTEKLLKGGEHILKLDIGTIYRKLAFYFTDDEGNGIEPVSGNIEIIYNTADTPISIDIDTLKMMNTGDFGENLPKGYYVFDFSGYKGFSEYAGSRDFIDTSRLTEFWVRFTTKDNCNVTTIQENLSRLR